MRHGQTYFFEQTMVFGSVKFCLLLFSCFESGQLNWSGEKFHRWLSAGVRVVLQKYLNIEGEVLCIEFFSCDKFGDVSVLNRSCCLSVSRKALV